MRGGAVVRIVSVNDVYELANLPRLKTLLRLMVAEGRAADAVVLAGDFVSPSTLSSIDSGAAMVDTLLRTGVTHVCFGNHEADLKLSTVVERVNEFVDGGGVWLNSNMPDFPSTRTSPHATILSPCGRARVALLGVIGDEDEMFRDGTFKGCEIDGVLGAVHAAVQTLAERGGIDALVPVTHQSVDRDVALVEGYRGAIPLPLVVGGHEHEPMLVERAGGTEAAIVKTGSDAVRAAVATITFESARAEDEDGAPMTLASVDVEFRNLLELAPELTLQSRVERHMLLVESLASSVFVDVGRPLESFSPRRQQTSIGALVASSIRDETGADVAVINGATIKGESKYPDGRLTLADLKAELPFPTKIITVDLPGFVLQAAVEYSRTMPHGADERRSYLQCDSGVEIDADDGFTIRKTTWRREAFDADATYSVALPRNLLAGFCTILPLIEWADANRDALPSRDDYIPAQDHVIRHFAKRMWNRLPNFEEMDRDGNGTLERDEVASAIQALTGEPIQDAALDHFFLCVDGDNDGRITLDEWKRVKRHGK